MAKFDCPGTSNSSGRPGGKENVPEWWEHDTRLYTPPRKRDPASSSIDDRCTPRQARFLQNEMQRQAYLSDAKTNMDLQKRNTNEALLKSLLADCEDGSVVDKLVGMVDNLLESQATQQSIIKELISKRSDNTADSQIKFASPTKRQRFSGASTATGGSEISMVHQDRYRVGENAFVLRRDGSWSPCHVTEIKNDGTVTVVTDIAPQAQKRILPENLHKQLRAVDGYEVKQEDMSRNETDSPSRSGSVARNCFDASDMESDLPGSEASWPMSVMEKQTRMNRIDRRIHKIDRKDLEGEVKALRKKIRKLTSVGEDEANRESRASLRKR